MILLLGKNGLFGQHFIKLYPEVIALGRAECDITHQGQVMDALRTYHPDVVINAAGVVPKSPTIHDTMLTLQTNGLAPLKLAQTCTLFGCRLVHISTSDVFSGNLGAYREDDYPTPTDLYGISKALGEVTTFPHLTIRTSFVGFPDSAGRGLLAWASSQKKLIGYDKVIWNGLVATELAQVVMNLAHGTKTGILHLHSDTVSKYELLSMAKDIWDWKIELVKESDVAPMPHQLDRTLRGMMVSKPLRQQLNEMKQAWSNME